MKVLVAAVACAVLVVGCSTPSDSPTVSLSSATAVSSSQATGQKVVAWFNGSQAAWAAWTADLGKTETALKSADPAAITAACTALGVDATTFSAYLPSPDAQVTAHLTEAVRDATDGSASCVSGDYTTATSKILAMNSQITASSTRLSQLK